MDDLVFLGNLFFMSVKVDSNAFHVAKLGVKSKNFQEKGNLGEKMKLEALFF